MRTLIHALFLPLLLSGSTPLFHGGGLPLPPPPPPPVYGGPGDAIQPGPTPGPKTGGQGGGGPSTPGPTGPNSPGPMGPTTGGPGAGRGPVTGKGAPMLEDDFSRWHYWWEFNKNAYLDLKAAVHEGGQVTGSDDYFLGRTTKSLTRDSLKPTEKEVLAKVVPALFRAVEETKERNIVSSCMIALAKIGLEPERVLALLRTKIDSNDQEIAETSVISMGILGASAAVPLLVDLVEDGTAGRALAGSPGGVNYRTRSFAAYGLGLLAHANADLVLKERVFNCLDKVLADPRASQRDLKITAIQAMRILRVSPKDGYKAEALYHRVISSLVSFLENGGAAEQVAQAHVPSAIASLVAREHYSKGDLRRRFTATLTEPKASIWMRQSCALALGQMARPEDVESSRVLQEFAKSGKDQQARAFALISLGQIGGEKNRSFLLQQMQDARKIDQAWVGLAIGVLAHEARRNGGEVDRFAGDAVHRQLGANKNRDVQAGLCVALGLIGHKDAADDVMRLLQEKSSDESLAGYACLSLGLMKHRPAIDQIRSLAEDSVRRQERLRQAAVALGLLGDKAAADALVELLSERGSSQATYAAIASALGQIGDSRSLDPLVEVLGNGELTDRSRSYAAVALGSVADKEDRPWNAKFAINLNYRANTETLTNQNAGVLDIL